VEAVDAYAGGGYARLGRGGEDGDGEDVEAQYTVAQVKEFILRFARALANTDMATHKVMDMCTTLAKSLGVDASFLVLHTTIIASFPRITPNVVAHASSPTPAPPSPASTRADHASLAVPLLAVGVDGISIDDAGDDDDLLEDFDSDDKTATKKQRWWQVKNKKRGRNKSLAKHRFVVSTRGVALAKSSSKPVNEKPFTSASNEMSSMQTHVIHTAPVRNCEMMLLLGLLRLRLAAGTRLTTLSYAKRICELIWHARTHIKAR
jgi:hypothetical protein